jgi:hypothetical protein
MICFSSHFPILSKLKKTNKYNGTPAYVPQHILVVRQKVLHRLPPKAGIILPFENPLDIFRAIGHLVHKVPAGIRKVLATLIPNLMFFQQLL